jgi:hypothetical protein
MKGLGLKNKLPIQLSQNQDIRGLICGTGRYAEATTTTAFDDWTAFTCIVLYSSYEADHSGTGTNYCPFSIWYENGGNKHGFYIWKYTSSIYGIYGEGNSDSNSIALASNHTYKYSSNYGRSGSIMGAIAFGATAATTTNNEKLYLYSDTGTSSLVADSTLTNPSTLSENATWTNWGSIGTNSKIRMGNLYNGSSTSQQAPETFMIHRVQLWDSLLSQASIEKTLGYNSTDKKMARHLIDYNQGSYTQPVHEWIPTIGSTTISDTGSGTAVDLAVKGGADIGYAKQN